MNALVNRAQELLEKGEVCLFIGYEEGTRGPRPLLCETAEDAKRLIFNDKCTGNLAVYLTRKDLVKGKRVAIVASYYALKNIAQLFAENQLNMNNLVVIGVTDDGVLREFGSAEEIAKYVREIPPPQKAEDEALVARLDAMTPAERWHFWKGELSKCFKCYACRAACPMCYCTKCIVEVNAPQWIDPWSAPLSNMEWQINRAMHMAGRCSECGSCGAACPLGIPVHLLSFKVADVVRANFGAADESDGRGNVLSTFKPDDKENFIL